MALQTLSLESDAYIDYTLHEDQEALVQNNRDIGNLRVRHIKSLTITNFKSFQGKHYVGPFTDFTAVIGPNGGGKSNVLDAIAFALGLTIRDLRCASPEELVYSKQ
jgi:structural maintenance of chromosome 1